MDKRFELTRQQKLAIKNLVDAIKMCKESGIQFISENTDRYYALNGKHIDAFQNKHGGIGFTEGNVGFLPSVYIPSFHTPNGDFEVWFNK